eukprot:12419043-Karenia_brevis.AAC.1
MMKQMAGQLAGVTTAQNQKQKLVAMQNQNSLTSEGSKSSVPQRFDMKAPGGTGVADETKVPILPLGFAEK